MRDVSSHASRPLRLLGVFPAAFFGFLKLSRLIIFFLAGLGSDGSSLPLHRMGCAIICDVLGCPLSTRKMGVGIIGFHSWLLANKLRDLRSAFSLLPLC
ncbi:hypothetical protein NC653_001366 [Populus alba x Populus x berolinensis]|uniref:Uncharacterized protein n=1 Tax=Populus alba x Populus x berolinensis TaxID=444605 RepID=A0AAD6RKZ0_9ROSI|nr:hypothetical protein NC653_001366 [Populus alba x Populus x berolinensis]